MSTFSINKRIYFALVLLAVSFSVSAQGRLSLQMFSAGVKTGISIGDMRLTAECYDMYKHKMTANAVAGAYFQYRTPFGLSVRPEIAYVGRGANLEWEDVKYRMRAHCLDMRVGVIYNFTIPKTLLSPYVVVAPMWNATLGGRVSYTDDFTEEIDMPLSKSNMKMHDFDMFCGAGVEYPVFGKGWAIYLSGEVGYNWGLVRNYAKQEQTGNLTVLNPNLDQQLATGGRLGRGIEITVRVGVPFGMNIKRNQKTLNDEETWTEEAMEEPEDTPEAEETEEEETKPAEKPQEVKPAEKKQKEEQQQPSQPQLKEEDSEELEDLQ